MAGVPGAHADNVGIPAEAAIPPEPPAPPRAPRAKKGRAATTPISPELESLADFWSRLEATGYARVHLLDDPCDISRKYLRFSVPGQLSESKPSLL